MKYTLGENKITISNENNLIIGIIDMNDEYLIYCDTNNLKQQLKSFIDLYISYNLSKITVVSPEEASDMYNALKRILYTYYSIK